MTKDKKAKEAARALSASTGGTYAASRRKTRERPSTSDGLSETRERLIPPVTALFEPDRCANCFRPLPDDVEGLFCDSWCNEIADNVRYWRRIHRDDRANDPGVQQAIQTRVAFMLARGYDSLGRRLPVSTRAQVKARDGGKCVECGKAGTEIDHIAGSSRELDNLQLLCSDCHQAKTRRNMVPAEMEEQQIIERLFQTRVLPELATRLADDHVEWSNSWRQLKRERRKRFIERLEEMGIDATPPWTWADKVLELEDALADVEPDLGMPEDYDGGFGGSSYFARAMQRED